MPVLSRRAVRLAAPLLAASIAAASLAACARPQADPAPGARAAATGPVRVSRAPFGTLPEGRSAELFTIVNARGVEIRATNYGGIITHLLTPDRAGRLDDIVLGYDALDGYVRETPYFGAIVGRYANRIARGRFTLDGVPYQLATNNGPNALHGGLRGFDKRLWTPLTFESDSGSGVVLRYTSFAGEEGYPGTLRAMVRYMLTPRDELIVDYEATTDAPTVVNLSQHSYFNLAGTGPGAGPGTPLPGIGGHVLQLDASLYTPVDSTLIPTGEILPVGGTPFSFLSPRPIGGRIGADNPQLKIGGGYDHNYVLDRGGRAGLVRAAHVSEPTTGRTLTIHTTEPGVQFYTGNFLDGSIRGKHGRVYAHRTGFCLETQHFPDSPNHSAFPSTVLRPGQTYRSRTVFTFGVER